MHKDFFQAWHNALTHSRQIAHIHNSDTNAGTAAAVMQLPNVQESHR